MSTVYFRTGKHVMSLQGNGTLTHVSDDGAFVGHIYYKKYTMQELVNWFGGVEIINEEEVIANV